MRVSWEPRFEALGVYYRVGAQDGVEVGDAGPSEDDGVDANRTFADPLPPCGGDHFEVIGDERLDLLIFEKAQGIPTVVGQTDLVSLLSEPEAERPSGAMVAAPEDRFWARVTIAYSGPPRWWKKSKRARVGDWRRAEGHSHGR